jgi:hypothetical protein
MIELVKGCPHFISPYGVRIGALRFVFCKLSMLIGHPVVSTWMSGCGVPIRIATYYVVKVFLL